MYTWDLYDESCTIWIKIAEQPLLGCSQEWDGVWNLWRWKSCDQDDQPRGFPPHKFHCEWLMGGAFWMAGHKSDNPGLKLFSTCSQDQTQMQHYKSESLGMNFPVSHYLCGCWASKILSIFLHESLLCIQLQSQNMSTSIWIQIMSMSMWIQIHKKEGPNLSVWFTWLKIIFLQNPLFTPSTPPKAPGETNAGPNITESSFYSPLTQGANAVSPWSAGDQ